MNCNINTTSIDRKRTMEAASNNTWESKTSTKKALPKVAPKFTVTYSRLCDGGAQEMSTAVSCVREIFPNASIATHRRTPQEDTALATQNIEVIISCDCDCDGNTNSNSSSSNCLWSAKQKNLYEKYPKKRKKSMKEIRKVLGAFKASFEQHRVLLLQQQQQATMTLAPPPPPPQMVPTSPASTTRTKPSLATTGTPPPELARPGFNEVSEDFSTMVAEGFVGDSASREHDHDHDESNSSNICGEYDDPLR